MLGVGGGSEDPVVGGGDSGLSHQLLGEDFAAFELRGVPPRSENLQALALKGIDDSGGQRLFRSHDGQVDPLALGELNERPEVSRFDRQILRIDRGAGIPWRAKHGLDARRLLQLPAESVLAPSFSDHENFQRDNPRKNPTPTRQTVTQILSGRPVSRTALKKRGHSELWTQNRRFG